MPSVAVKLYSVYFKLLLKHKLQSQIQSISNNQTSSFGVTSRPEESTAAANPSFSPSPSSSSADGAATPGGVATKDIHIDPLTSLSVRIFLPDSCLSKTPLLSSKPNLNPSQTPRRSSYGGGATAYNGDNARRSSYGGETPQTYRGYLPSVSDRSQLRKLPIVLQFHGGAFVSGSNVSVSNDLFCRRIAKLLDVIVIAVGYRLAPECKYPAVFEDGMKVVQWLGKQANLAVLGGAGAGAGGRGAEARRAESHWRIVDTFGAASVEPWLAAHGDPTR